MMISRRQAVHWLFDVAVIIKAIDGVLEIVAGAFLLLKPGWLGPHAGALADTLLLHHPTSWMAQALGRWSDNLSMDTEHFAATYLMSHGAAKVFIAWGLIREKLWAFPVALVVFGVLIVYQCFRFSQTHSITLAGLIALDIAVCYLVWREYGFRREAANGASETSVPDSNPASTRRR